MPDPGNRRRFEHSCIYMLHYSEMLCDQYPAGFTIDYIIDSPLITVIRGHPRERKINQEKLILLCGNTSGPMYRWSFVHISLDSSGALIKYFGSSVSKIWDSINIFMSIVEVLIKTMAKLLVP